MDRFCEKSCHFSKFFNFKIIIFAILLSLISMNSYSFPLTSTGKGSTSESAIQFALRSALNKSLGGNSPSIGNPAVSKPFYNRIFSDTIEYINKFEVLSERKDPVNGKIKVKIKVSFNEAKIHDLLNNLKNGPRSHQNFQKTNFENRRIVVLYSRQTGKILADALNSGFMSGIDLKSLVGDKLSSHGFRVFLPNKLTRIKNRNLELSPDRETAIQTARQANGDAVVVINTCWETTMAIPGQEVNVTVALKAYDVTTGELFANVSEPYKEHLWLSYPNGQYFEHILEKLAKRATDQLVTKIVKRFGTNRENFVVFAFRDTSGSTQNKICKVMQSLGWRYRIDRQYGSYLEVEVFSETDPTSANFRFKRDLRKAMLPLTQVEMKGSEIVYSGQ